jgi:DNA processing protein
MEPGTVDAYLLALVNCPVFGLKSIERILSIFPNAKDAWEASESAFDNLGITRDRLNFFFDYRKRTTPERYLELLNKQRIAFVTRDDERYPEKLKTIFDPPFALFVKGEIPAGRFVSIVGSRHATEYGLNTAYNFAKDLSAQGVTIVSGLADGIDSAAHEGTLTTGKTIAILGSGLLHRRGNASEKLEHDILERGGAVMSEFPLFAPGLKHHFPMRNRIIAGLSEAIIVVEAALPSGSLISAKCAIDEGREVFAVPGPITSKYSEGTNNLLKEGAHPATSANDILGRLGITPRKRRAYAPETPLEGTILDLLRAGNLHIDELIISTKTDPQTLSQTLVTLELKAVIKNVGGMRFESLVT